MVAATFKATRAGPAHVREFYIGCGSNPHSLSAWRRRAHFGELRPLPRRGRRARRGDGFGAYDPIRFCRNVGGPKVLSGVGPPRAPAFSARQKFDRRGGRRPARARQALEADRYRPRETRPALCSSRIANGPPRCPLSDTGQLFGAERWPPQANGADRISLGSPATAAASPG